MRVIIILNIVIICLNFTIRTTWVNAWDSHSFIGNGGNLDNSIDGWFVGGTNINTEIENGSFLHNYIIFSQHKKIINI